MLSNKNGCHFYLSWRVVMLDVNGSASAPVGRRFTPLLVLVLLRVQLMLLTSSSLRWLAESCR